MTQLALVKHPSGLMLVPSAANDEAFVRKLKAGELIAGEFKRPRNGGHHRKLFALLDIMYERQDRFPTLKHMLVDVKVKTGHFDEHITSDGQIVYVPRSIAYSEMGQEAFEPFYSRVVDIAMQDPIYLRGLSADALENEIMRRLHFA